MDDRGGGIILQAVRRTAWDQSIGGIAALLPRQKAAADAACVQSGAETSVFFLAASENRHIQRFLSLCAGFVCGILSYTDECCAGAVQTAAWSKRIDTKVCP